MEIYLDENLSPFVAEALNQLCKGHFSHVEVFSTVHKIGRGKKDEEIIPYIGQAGGVLITKDLNIHRTNVQFELCKQHQIGLFFLVLQKGQSKHWDIIKLLINRWEEIINNSQNERLPFAFRVKIRGKTEKL